MCFTQGAIFNSAMST